MSNNYTHILTKGTQSALSSTAVENGKVRITTDTHELYIDTDSGRIQISDIVKDYSEEEIKAILAPLPNIYLSSDTHKLFIFDDNGECVDITNNSVDVSTTATGHVVSDTVPEDTNVLWINTSNGGIMKYYDLSSSSWQAVTGVWG